MKYTCDICNAYLMDSNRAKGECAFGHKIEEKKYRYWTSSMYDGDETIYATKARANEHNQWVRDNTKAARENDIREWHLDDVTQYVTIHKGGE